MAMALWMIGDALAHGLIFGIAVYAVVSVLMWMHACNKEVRKR